MADTYPKVKIGGEGDNFLARLGEDRYADPPRWAFPFVGTHRRITMSPVHGLELDDLLYSAFDCHDTDDTFRGKLRGAVESTKPAVLTSLCGYRIGFQWDHNEDAELTLLVTLLPGSLTKSEAALLIPKLQAVLKSHDERLGSIAIEIAEHVIVFADSDMNTRERNATMPAREMETTSYQPSPPPGASIGLADDQDGAGTLGPFMRIAVGGMPPQYCAMTCSHVLSSSKSPAEPGQETKTVVCPADTDSAYWGQKLDQVIDSASSTPAQVQEAEAQKLRAATFERAVSAMYASSGIRSSLEGQWVLDWALFALDPKRFETFEGLSNVPLQKSKHMFEAQIHPNARDVQKPDWKPRSTCRYVTTSALAKSVKERVRVFKAGRTTGHTTGYLLRIDPSITVAHFLYGSDGAEHAVLVKGKALAIRADPIRGLFADLGDSGALVLNGHAEAVGTVIAVGQDSAAHGVTYLTPLGPAMEHMREVVERSAGRGKVEVEVL